MCADRSVRDEELKPDLAIAEAIGSHLSDLELLRGELVARLGDAAAARFPRCAQFLPRPPAPWRGAKSIKSLAGGSQRHTGIGHSPSPSKPGPICELRPGPRERPSAQVSTKCNLEESLRVVVVGQERSRMSQADVKRRRRRLTGESLHLLDDWSNFFAAPALNCGVGQILKDVAAKGEVVRRIGWILCSTQVRICV